MKFTSFLIVHYVLPAGSSMEDHMDLFTDIFEFWACSYYLHLNSTIFCFLSKYSGHLVTSQVLLSQLCFSNFSQWIVWKLCLLTLTPAVWHMIFELVSMELCWEAKKLHTFSSCVWLMVRELFLCFHFTFVPDFRGVK